MIRWVFLFGFLALAASLSAANLPVKRYALFIGANQGGKAQQPLLFAQRDALKMQEVMQEVGGVGPADQVLLLDPTPDGIRGALGALASKMSGSGVPETRRTEFLFYYSGHSDETGLLLGDRTFSYNDLRTGLQSVPADVRIAILDSCSSGAFARLKGGVQRAPFLDQDSSQMKGHAFLTSSSDTEASQESDSLGGSFFTHYLVSGLRGGADKTGNGRITLNEAYEYAYQYTLARTESTQAGPQHPSYEIQLSGTGDLILSDLQASNARLEVASDVAGRVYVRDPEGRLFAEVVKGAGTPLVLAFPPGAYAVVVITPKQALNAQVTLAAQGVAKLGPADFHSQTLSRFATRGANPADPTNLGVEDRLCSILSEVTQDLIPGPPYEEKPWEDKFFGASLITDEAKNADGIQMSVMVSATSETVRGVQLSGLVDLSHGRVSGVQAAGLFTVAESGFNGIQASGLFNNAGGENSHGIQTSGAFNWSLGTYWGIQYSTVNIANDLNGVQFAGFNLAHNLNGIQFGALNLTNDTNGIQFGAVNVTNDFNGVQFGAVNVGSEVNGAVFGVVNVNSHFSGVSFGLINVSPDAYYYPTFHYDSDNRREVLLQWGMGWLYFVTGFIFDPDEAMDTHNFDQLEGAGTSVKWGPLYWDIDGGTVKRFLAADLEGFHPYVRTTLGFSFGWIGVEAGARALIDTSGDTYSIGSLRFGAPVTTYVGLRLF